MGGSASRIWSEICAIESDTIRAAMIQKVLASPDYAREAQRYGVFELVVAWVLAFNQGRAGDFPYRIQHSGPGFSSSSGFTSSGSGSVGSQLIESPAAKALDYFQEALDLLGIGDSEGLTHEQVRSAYKRESLRVHPDKGGSEAQFDSMRRAYQYVTKILDRLRPPTTADEKARMTATVSIESAQKQRDATKPAAPIQLSAKKLDMSTFNRLFEENRLPDPGRDTGYGEWLSSQDTDGSEEQDARLKGKFNQQVFEQVFREKALRHTTAVTKRLEPDAMIAAVGVELGGETNGSYTAAFGSEVQFMDLKEAYTSGSTRYQEVADVRVQERGARSIEEAKRLRNVEMERVDPDEKARIAAAAAVLEERERQRRLRLAKQDTATDSWSEQMRRRLLVTDR
jgi:hypothetical protein